MTAPLVSGTFTTTTGHKHGQRLGVRTINCQLEGFSLAVETGIYAGVTVIADHRYPSAIHYGPRPMLGDVNLSLEAHLIDVQLDRLPSMVDLELWERLRAIEDFADEIALRRQILLDIEAVRQRAKQLVVT